MIRVYLIKWFFAIETTYACLNFTHSMRLSLRIDNSEKIQYIHGNLVNISQAY